MSKGQSELPADRHTGVRGIPGGAIGNRESFALYAAPWAGGASDLGRRHESNQDALALAAGADATGAPFAVVAVSDGVSTSSNSELASALAAETVCAHLLAFQDGLAAPDLAELEEAMTSAFDDANVSIVAKAVDDLRGSWSCTMIAAILKNGVVLIGNVGDSRCYWFPDGGEPKRLSVDDSMAQARIELGVSRKEAETGFRAHAITKWLGPESPTHLPSITRLEVDQPGWLLVCTDGLWNYASEPEALGSVLRQALGEGPDQDASQVASRLVNWGNSAGGRDNITAALLRLKAPN